jgi:hypothetical protein
MLDRRALLGLEVDPAALAALLDDHVSGRAELSRSLWSLLSLGLWSDRHYEPAPAFA